MRTAIRAAALATATAATVGAAATFGTAGVAIAATPTTTTSSTAFGAPRTLAAIQTLATKATGARITALDKAIPKVTSNSALSSADRATILATLNSDLAAMQSLATKIAADTTAPQAETDYRTIFTTYRVFAVALPQASYAAAADDLTDTTLPKLTAAQKSLAALLAGPDSAKSTPALQAELADMATKIAAAQSTVNGISAAALAVTPSQYDADHQALAQIRQSVSTALADAKAAGTDGSSIVAALT
jgi:hypothetical protein